MNPKRHIHTLKRAFAPCVMLLLGLPILFATLPQHLADQSPGSSAIVAEHIPDRLFAGHTASAQRRPAWYAYPYHHLEWYTIESEHFLVHYQQGNSRPAQVTSRIAEEIYEPITSLYEYTPDEKVNILLIDRLDYSNGAAFFYDNKIEIWLPSLDTPLRGTHDWLRNVITHEFTHIVQLQASMKRTRRVPAVYLQWLSYEEVRRPDVLYGFPRGMISYPLSGVSMPAWLAEGTAQYMRSEIFYDDWDSHRDMLLRTRMLQGNYLSLTSMGTFTSKNSLERELVYNQGFAFTRHLSERFGEQILADITRAFSRRGVYEAPHAISIATGGDGQQIFDEWVDGLRAHYTLQAEGRHVDQPGRSWVENEGFFNFYPAFSRDGCQIAYISNKPFDGSLTTLYLKELCTDSTDHEAGAHTAHTLQTHPTEHTSAIGHDTTTSTDNDLSEAWARTAHTLQTHPPEHTSSRPGASERHGHSHHAHPPGEHCSLAGTPLIRRAETAFDFSPDGRELVYTRVRLNRYGERYRDLYLYNTESRSSRQLTHGARMQLPSWSPDGAFIAGSRIYDGSSNLYLYNIQADSLVALTRFEHGEQVYRPAWHPDADRLFVAWSGTGHRGIYSISASAPEASWQVVLSDEYTDYRDPAVSDDGRWLYFSADPDGVFNIYRLLLADQSTVEQVTNVVGGAFMPHPRGEELLYSEFTAEGYKIARLDLSAANPAPATFISSGQSGRHADSLRSPREQSVVHRQTATTQSTSDSVLPLGQNSTRVPGQEQTVGMLNQYDDTDVYSFEEYVYAVADTGRHLFTLPTAGGSEQRSLYRYEDQFTRFQFYPVLRFDNYTRLRGDNLTLLSGGRFQDLGQNIWRDSKLGVYMASREMRDRFTLFAGALFGPGSRPASGLNTFFTPARLVNLDRDMFMEVEYSGLPFLKRHWSPTVSASFYNIRRNVEDGLLIEEFPCTACLPDTTSTDIAYNMWMMELALVSKVNQWSLVELAYSYSPYRVSTSSFYSREFRQEVQGSTSRYFIGDAWSAAYIFNLTYPERYSSIAPLGWRGQIRYRYEPGELLDRYDIRDGTLIPVYNTTRNHSFEADLRTGFMLGQQRLQWRGRFFSYLRGPDEFFYLDYIGGLTGMRSYPFFSLGGNTTAFSQVSWFVPLKTGIDRQVERFTLNTIFLRLFGEAGNGWGGPLDISPGLKTGAGAELRVALNSYYLFPTSFFISGAYGFQSYDLRLPDAFLSDAPGGRVRYGQQVLINFGILFDFEL